MKCSHHIIYMKEIKSKLEKLLFQGPSQKSSGFREHHPLSKDKTPIKISNPSEIFYSFGLLFHSFQSLFRGHFPEHV